jgi:hypothetical protein
VKFSPFQFGSMQGVAAQEELFLKFARPTPVNELKVGLPGMAVDLISQDGVPARFKVNPDLVHSPRNWMALDQGKLLFMLFEPIQNFKGCEAGFTSRMNGLTEMDFRI